MSLKDINFKSNYSSEKDDILKDFYIPVLSESIIYNRISGFFSSGALAVAARGIAKFLKNEGQMRLICSAKLKEEDVNAIKINNESFNKIIDEALMRDLEMLEDIFIENHLKALSWMLSKKKLEIKIAIVLDGNGLPLNEKNAFKSGIFHQKIGILQDLDNNTLSFSGSINETANGWLRNIEEFKVFKSWINEENKYLLTDINSFDSFWNQKNKYLKLVELSEAIKSKLLEKVPDNIDKLNLDFIAKKYFVKKNELKLRSYQIDAVNKWLENDKKGIFEMATGTGKTITALGCLKEINEEFSTCITVISCPQIHLVNQWEQEIKKINLDIDQIIIANNINYKWKNELNDLLIDNFLGHKNKLVIITSHDTLTSKDFSNIFNENCKTENVLLICDEVHGIGSIHRKENLSSKFKFRLGLSATPKRWFDDSGTIAIFNYFGPVIFEFPLFKAITEVNPDTGETFLTPYRYIPLFANLNDSELENYINITYKLIRLFNKKENNDREVKEKIENYLFMRANIIKEAEAKLTLLKDLLVELGENIKFTLVYCSPKQINNALRLINGLGLIAHKFTMEEGTKSEERFNGLSERSYLLKNFSEGRYQILVAMKCLDEGVDIPPAKNAIIMSSSSNPREYIQRIGRVVRRYPNKHEAVIYDFIVTPSNKNIPVELRDIEYKIFEKELQRFLEIAKNANNSVSAIEKINNFFNINFL